MKIIEKLRESLLSASLFNSNVQVAPSCVLWTDKDRQWEAAIPRLQTEIHELYILGDYVPEMRSGPAIWLRCVIANTIDGHSIPAGTVPILYLPGISRQDLRAVENCADAVKPLAELQYHGAIWSQVNAKDWTILAFLMSGQGGLKLDVAQDTDAKNSMLLALNCLLDEEIELLEGKRLDKDYFNTLLMGGDPVKDLLLWLDTGETFRASRSETEWKAFVEVCKSQLAFNPDNEGQLGGAVKFAHRQGPWKQIWERYSEAPKRYPNIPLQIRKTNAPPFDLFADVETVGGWPQWNEEQENQLRIELNILADLPAHNARKRIKEMAQIHSCRSSLVWAELGEANLAKALSHLKLIAEYTSSPLAAGSIQDLTEGYQSQGWQVDAAVLMVLQLVETEVDFIAISSAIRSMYLPWLETSARYLQKLVDGNSYPGGTVHGIKEHLYQDGDCILFVDGLRYDTAQMLAEMLESRGLNAIKLPVWTALPSVTATGKAAITPVRTLISGSEECVDFEPEVTTTKQSLKGGYHLKKLLSDAGWQILDKTKNGNGIGKAWCEYGDIDHEGHDRGWKLAKHLPSILREIIERIEALLDVGWKRVKIVTDHGWLLMPGGLPKIELPSDLTDSKWGRCAAIKQGAATEERQFPWFWNPGQYFALANGISCYKKGEEYTHGGLSLQECLTLEVTIESNVISQNKFVVISDSMWKGLRCKVVIEGHQENTSLDIRTNPGNKLTSVIMNVKPFGEDGAASVVVKDDSLTGCMAYIVIVDSNGNLVAQQETIIGGEY